MNQSNASFVGNVPPTTAAPEKEYDSEGAMKFIIATVLVYSVFGVFCTLLSRIKRGRGRRHEVYTQDEHITKYLKKSKSLKFDGYKMKLMFECSKYTDQVQQFEEKMKLKELEREMSSTDYRNTSFSLPSGKSSKKKRKASGIGAVGKMGMSLFYIGDPRPSIPSSAEHESLLGSVLSKAGPSGEGRRESASNPEDINKVKHLAMSTHIQVHKDAHSVSSPDVSDVGKDVANVKLAKSEICIQINVEDASDPNAVVKELETIRCHLPGNEPSGSGHSLETGL